MARSNRDEFGEQFSLLDIAGTGVIVTRTREPFRAADALQAWATANTSPDLPLCFKSWSIVTGWKSFHVMDPEMAPSCDGNVNILEAFRAINGEEGSNEQSLTEGFGDGVFAVMWPHFYLPNMPALIQLVADYSRDFSEIRKRVVLIMPPEAEIPRELSDMVYFLDFDTPSCEELVQSMVAVVEAMPAEDRQPTFSDDEKILIAQAGLGVTEAEFEAAVAMSLARNQSTLPELPVDNMVQDVLLAKTEAVKRSEILEIMKVEDMDNVGGLSAFKEWLDRKAAVMTPEAREAGVDAPRGCALVGPPGTGKSLVAKATAHTLQQPLIRFDISKVFSHLIGSSESRVREALKMVDSMAPCVCLLDEIDKGFDNPGAASGDSGVSKRVLGNLLTHMQESDSAVFWVVTMNRTGGMPPELLRKGRLDEVFSVTVPNDEERRAILEIHLRKRGQDPAKIEDMDKAIEGSHGYVAAELEAAVKDAVEVSFVDKKALTGTTIADQLAEMKPLAEAFKEEFTAMQQWAENNARPASGRAADVQRRERERRQANPPTKGKRSGQSAPRRRVRAGENDG